MKKSTVLIQAKILRLTTSWGLTVHLADTDSPFQRELDLHLPSMKAFETITFKLRILADLAFTSYKETTFVEHKVYFYYSVLNHQTRSTFFVSIADLIAVIAMSMAEQIPTCFGSSLERLRPFHCSVQTAYFIHQEVCQYPRSR